MSRRNLFAFVVCCFLGYVSFTAGVAVMSVDLGSGWMKIAIVSPGVPMEIALNRESKRKTPVAVSFRNNEREFGEGALAVGVRFPQCVFSHLLDLLGKKVDNPMVEKYKKRFPHHEIIPDPHTGTVIYKKSEDEQYKLEELLSMILNRAREYAQDFAGQTIKDVVITVPVFFNQAERQAMMRAAALANLKVLQLINVNSAVALNYGVFRRKDFNTTAQNIMFYDMGAATTTATIAGFQLVKTKERGYTETNPQLTILGVGYDRELGGFDFTLRLRNHLAKVFDGRKKTKTDVFSNPRAMAKLLKEAERVKMVLSANPDHYAQVENLLDDEDFRVQVTREEFEGLCVDLFDRVGNPVKSALKAAAMTMDDIDQVILVGAGTRMPKIQEKLLEVVKKPELGKNLNTDESAAMGAVYQAAHLSQGFKVKKFLIKDSVLFPIQVDFEREIDSDNKEGKGIKVVSRTLFAISNPFPLKKVITFNRVARDPFTFHVNYGRIDMSPEDIKMFGSLNISKVELNGIKAAADKHASDESEPKGVKAHFRMDESGILTLDLVESVFEKVEETEAEAESESAFTKLGSTISKLFSGGGSDEETEKKEEPKQADESSDAQEGTKDEKKEEVEPDNITAAENITQQNVTQQPQNETKSTTKSKMVTIKEPISVLQKKLDMLEPSEDNTKASIKFIEDFNKMEREQKAKEEAKNNLESFILDTQDKLYQEEYEKASTEEEREKIRTALIAASEWLEEEGESAKDASIFTEKLTSLQTGAKDLFIRVKEHRDRPEILAGMRELLNMSEVFLKKMRELRDDEQYFTDVEMSTLEKLINDTKAWKTSKEEEQAKIPLHEKPVLTVRRIAEKMATLDREVKYLVNKARTSKPKVNKDKASESTTPAANNTANTTKEEKPDEKKDEEKPTAIPETEETKESEEPVDFEDKTEPDEQTPHTEL